MQFDWTTFVLEMLNFLVLVWILKRFLYRPVLAILDARQARIRQESAKAEKMLADADILREQYEARLAGWNQEREQNRRKLEEELTQARATGMENLKQQLADEEAKARARSEALTASREAALVRQAAGEAFGTAAAMLRRLASPELTASIVRMFQEDLAAQPEDDHAALRKAAAALVATSAVEITSAHPLDEPTQGALKQALSSAAGKPLDILYKVDPALIAGLRAVVGECQLHANLADELAYFQHRNGHA